MMIFHSYVNVYQRVPLFFVIFQYFPLRTLFFWAQIQVSTLQSPELPGWMEILGQPDIAMVND